jgi:hypothetical protein
MLLSYVAFHVFCRLYKLYYSVMLPVYTAIAAYGLIWLDAFWGRLIALGGVSFLIIAELRRGSIVRYVVATVLPPMTIGLYLSSMCGGVASFLITNGFVAVCVFFSRRGDH